MASTLTELLDIRSQLAEGFAAYLRLFVDMTAWNGNDTLPPFVFLPTGFPAIAAPRLYQRPDVVDQQRLHSETQQRRLMIDEQGLFVHVDDESGARVPWAKERRRIHRAVVLGRPGEGKTLLTQLTCRLIARGSLAALNRRTRPLPEIPIPLWLKVEDVLTEGSVEAAVNARVPGMVAAAVDRRAPHLPPLSPKPAADYLCRALLRSPLTWLFLDALDERPAGRPGVGLTRGLADLDRLHADARVLMTCRLREFREAELPDAAKNNLVKYELEPLEARQQHRLIRKWFAVRVPPQPDKVTEVEPLIEGHHQFRDMAANGLMLTLICTTAEHHDVHPDRTRRVNLYDLIIRDIVRRARGSDPMLDTDPRVGRRLRVLQRVAYKFFAANPGATLLNGTEWDDVALKACEGLPIAHPAPFVEELTRDVRDAGLLVSHGGSVRFLHRSFYEYLAASDLATQEPAEIVRTIAAHVPEPSWREVSIMAVAHLGLVRGKTVEAGQVVDAIRVEDGSPAAVILMGDAVADGGKHCVPETARQALRDPLLAIMRNDTVLAKARADAGAALGRIGDHRFGDKDVWGLPVLQSDPGPDGRLEPEPLLGFVEIPEGEFWMGSDT